VILPEAKDYKRIGEGDTGLNTGGMGAISPVPFVDSDMMKMVEERIVKPTVNGLAAETIPYQGFIFFGLINVAGNPMVIEYNVRMGDPETEVVMPRIESDLLEVFEKMHVQKLDEVKLNLSDKTATTVMVVSGGYPGDYEKGQTIVGLETTQDIMVFHAGTAMQGDKLMTAGGRVMAFTALASSKEMALQQCYSAINKVCYNGMYYRKDIGFDL
jgi:phosphoribosylamine--glycine ligase